MKLVKIIVSVIALQTIGIRVDGRDYLDSTQGRGWSPDNQWIAFTPSNSKNLLVVTFSGRRNFLLKPLGELRVDSGTVFASGSKGDSTKTVERTTIDRATLQIASPGTRRLESAGWSPKGDLLAYRFEHNQRALFSPQDETVLGTLSPTNTLPWEHVEDYRVSLDYEIGSKERRTRYVLRATRADSTLVKEVVFDTDPEIRCMGQQSFSGSTFLTGNKRSLLYPKHTANGWQLLLDDIGGQAPPRPITGTTTNAPLEWKLSPDGQALAVVESETILAVGPLNNWAQAGRVAVSNQAISVEWSGDGKFLAANSRRQLWLLEVAPETHRPLSELQSVHDNCNPQFWGWRGPRLFFNEADKHPGDVLLIDTSAGRQVTGLISGHPNTRGAPILRSISPDGTMLVCLFWKIDDIGHRVQELWKTKLDAGAAWELVYSIKSTEN